MIGAGGHAKVLIDTLLAQNLVPVGLLEVNSSLVGTDVLGVPVLAQEAILAQQDPTKIVLANGVGSVNIPTLRKKIFIQLKQAGFSFLTVIHPRAYIGQEVLLGEGCQIMAGSIIQPGCKLGENIVVNTNASVDHDGEIGDHTHLAPRVTLSGGVTVGESCHIGTGATVIQGIEIGCHVVVAAGAVVANNILSNMRVAGVPAKRIP